MAKQLYDYWFVQFDFPNEEGNPYKSSGGKMVWDEKLKREIPQGWSTCSLDNFLTIKNGRDHKHLADGVYPVYGSGGEMRRVAECLYNGESVLIPRKGSLNNVMYVNESFWTVDTMFYSEMKVRHSAKFVYYSIKDIDFTRWDSGTGVPSMTSSTLYSIRIVKPNIDILEKFNTMVTHLFVQMKQNVKQNATLTKQRDELLPLLMNGQVSVNYHLSVWEVAVNIGKFSYFIGLFLPSACRFEVDSPSLIFNGRGIRLPHFVFSGHLASQGRCSFAASSIGQ